MSLSVILSRPNHDDTTAYLHEWSEKIINFARERNIKVFDLHDNKATRKNLVSYLKKMQPTHVVINGHGAEDCVYGHDDELILDTKDCELMDSKILYVRSCRTGALLGPALVREGKAKSFIGYRRDFVFPFDATRTTTPLKDRIAKPVLECSNKIAFSLIKGESAREAHEKSQVAHIYWVRHYIDDSSIEAPQIIKCLLWNQANQVCFEN